MDDIGREPAFPVHPNGPIFRGMTYRQWLVGMALQGLLSNTTLAAIRAHESVNGRDVSSVVAQIAIAEADAVLAQLEKEHGVGRQPS